MTKHDTTLFLKAWLAAPLRVAAIAPSGQALSRLITSEISDATGHVVELGAGTGAFTRALIERGVDERDLTVIEFDIELVAVLRRRFPRARVLRMDAADLASAELVTLKPVGAVVSGLPLLGMPDAKVAAILRASFALLDDGDMFYQFTYGPSCPVRRNVMSDLGLAHARVGRVLANLPPASVYRLARQG